MSLPYTHTFGAWLMVCGLALAGERGTVSGNASKGPETRQNPQSRVSDSATAIPYTATGSSASRTATRLRKAAVPAKANAKAAQAGNPDRSGKTRVGAPGKMQVAEPKGSDGLSSEEGSKAWRVSHANGLTQEQKRAFRERKDKMSEMMALIKEKRVAMSEAEPEKRAALARELHHLILEEEGQGHAASAAARTAQDPRENDAAADKGGAAGQRRKQSEFRQLQMEKRKEEMRKDEIRKQQIERLRRIQESKTGSKWENRRND